MPYFFLSVSSVIAAQEPRAVAEAALVAWSLRDAKSLNAVAHSELKKRCHEARIVQFYVADKEEQRKVLVSGSDFEVVALRCEALRVIIPNRDNRLAFFDRYVDTVHKNDRRVVVFESGWKRKSDGVVGPVAKTEVVLMKSGVERRFLWSPAVRLHVDLDWDPTE